MPREKCAPQPLPDALSPPRIPPPPSKTNLDKDLERISPGSGTARSQGGTKMLNKSFPSPLARTLSIWCPLSHRAGECYTFMLVLFLVCPHKSTPAVC